VGLNEFAGYLAVGMTPFLAAFIAQRYGLRPQPFYLGIGYAVLGLGLSALLARDTRLHVGQEVSQHHEAQQKRWRFGKCFVARHSGTAICSRHRRLDLSTI
jgi:hypothetical protein